MNPRQVQFSTLSHTLVGLDSIVCIAIHYRLDGLAVKSQWWMRFSTPVHTGSGTHPTSYTMGIGCFPGVKQTPSSAEVKERVELYLYSPTEPCCKVNFTFLPSHTLSSTRAHTQTHTHTHALLDMKFPNAPVNRHFLKEKNSYMGIHFCIVILSKYFTIFQL